MPTQTIKISGQTTGWPLALASAAAFVAPAGHAAIVSSSTPFDAPLNSQPSISFADGLVSISQRILTGSKGTATTFVELSLTSSSSGHGFSSQKVSFGTVIDQNSFQSFTDPIRVVSNNCSNIQCKESGYGSGIFIFDVESNGGDRFGWVDVTVNGTPHGGSAASVTVNSWAYENTGASIHAGDVGSASAVPEPDSLALFALGGLGLAAAKRRRRAAQARLAA